MSIYGAGVDLVEEVQWALTRWTHEDAEVAFLEDQARLQNLGRAAAGGVGVTDLPKRR